MGEGDTNERLGGELYLGAEKHALRLLKVGNGE